MKHAQSPLRTCSSEHMRYLKVLRRKTVFVQLARAGLLLFILGVWELIAALQLVDPFIISSPSRIAKMIASLAADGSLFYHIGTTLWETLLGFAIAVLLGTGICRKSPSAPSSSSGSAPALPLSCS